MTYICARITFLFFYGCIVLVADGQSVAD